ncbi:dynein heavy chain 6, axonemal-like [Octopus sinensis]|uniref:Dynein heavy chain 6, axonemal-like n=1 Tax=Octopus sinensis TaxID=2607531 RepID=A0A7E6EM63_9MOLL|nr:dynein heavy chain 6, axonemal-like [Octopus sinensis]
MTEINLRQSSTESSSFCTTQKEMSSIILNSSLLSTNPKLFNFLTQAKFSQISSRLTQTEITEKEITRARDVYISVAERGAILYFVIADMAKVDPMYQFSLQYFKQIFSQSILDCVESGDTRLDCLVQAISIDAYLHVSRYFLFFKVRGLFEKHKLVFSFLLCVEIMLARNDLTSHELDLFIRGDIESIISEDLANCFAQTRAYVTSGDSKVYFILDGRYS